MLQAGREGWAASLAKVFHPVASKHLIQAVCLAEKHVVLQHILFIDSISGICGHLSAASRISARSLARRDISCLGSVTDNDMCRLHTH